MPSVVSDWLEAEVKDQVTRHGIVVWLDKEGHYTAFVDALKARWEASEAGYPVLGYRGSFLELMLALERYGSGLDPERLLIHLPGYGKVASLRETPMLELCTAGSPLWKALPTLIAEAAAGRVTPAELAAFLASPGLSLSGADAWLEQQLSGAPPGVAARLEALQRSHLVDGLLGDKRFLLQEIAEAEVGELAAHLLRHTGMDAAWLEHCLGPGAALGVRNVAEAFAGYLLAVEYVFDLKRPPVTRELQRLLELPKPLSERCLGLVQHFRAQHPNEYGGAATEAYRLVAADAARATAEELGKIDTFEFEEEKIREAAIAAAQAGNFRQALVWAEQRAGAAFWLDRDRKRRWAWTLIEHAAALGAAIERVGSGLPEGRSLGEAVEHYARKAYQVDAAHRRLEQRVQEMQSPELDHFDKLLEVSEAARRAYRAWADELGRSFARLCRAYGALPEEALQQRSLYERVVEPLLRDGEKVVLFMIDAFRFEMAKDLEAELKGAGISVDLHARLAELPTVTEVGMNVLAPVARGDRLSPKLGDKGFEGFRAGEFLVDDPKTRARAIGVRSVGKAAPLLKLADVCSMPQAQLQKTVKSAPGILIVHSLELDDAGEKGFGPALFEHTLRQIRAAWFHLSQAGVKVFVFTGDHGFLLQDRTAGEQAYGLRTDPHRRYVLEDHARAEPGMLTVPLSALGYDVPEEKYLLFREDTAVWKTTRSGAPFVHGGNSLQERVIPVLVVRRQRERGGSDTAYEVQVEALEDNLGRRRLRLKLRLAQHATGALAFTGAGQVTLGLRVKDRPDVTVTIVDVEGAAELHSGLLRVPVEGTAKADPRQTARGDWATVYFQIEGDNEERVQVEVFHPDGLEKIEPVTVGAWFEITGRAQKPPSRSSPPLPSASAEAEARPKTITIGIEDEGFRRVFEHLDRYGTVNEIELAKILDGPRRVRAFARQFDELCKRVAFRVRIDTTGVMKCYVKEAG